jgi:hypothetical protein
MAGRQSRNYGALHETQREIDEQQQQDTPAPEEQAARRGPLRTWTHYGGMVPQQASANKWIRQNHEIRMAANESSQGREEPAPGSTRGKGTQSQQSEQEQDQAELQEARAAVEEAKQREASERVRQQERDRSGPER